MANGENVIATAFAMHLCKIYLIDDRSNAHIIEADLFGTIEVLQRIRYALEHFYMRRGRCCMIYGILWGLIYEFGSRNVWGL